MALTPAATEAFFKTYYGPNNATVAIVGDIKPKEVIALIEQTFGKFRLRPIPSLVTEEPPQRGERQVEIEFDAEPALAIGYHKPTIGHPDDFVFDVIDEVLTEGVTSRLYGTLVRDNDWLHRCCRIPTIPECVPQFVRDCGDAAGSPYHCRSRGGYL